MTPREIVVFVSYENNAPASKIVEALIQALHIGRAEVGSDVLTGGCEVRLYYDAATLEATREWLTMNGIIYDLELR